MDELKKDRLPDAYSMISHGMDRWYEQMVVKNGSRWRVLQDNAWKPSTASRTGCLEEGESFISDFGGWKAMYTLNAYLDSRLERFLALLSFSTISIVTSLMTVYCLERAAAVNSR